MIDIEVAARPSWIGVEMSLGAEFFGDMVRNECDCRARATTEMVSRRPKYRQDRVDRPFESSSAYLGSCTKPTVAYGARTRALAIFIRDTKHE